MRIKIKYLNGIRFRRFIVYSAQKVNQMEQYLNDINVFPVADGDTGTNMSLTMHSIVEGAQKCKESSFEGISSAIANSALMGARGNSGAILAQFFQGLAEATRGKVRVTTESFAYAAFQAAEQARKAIAHPREGTIITVMKDWANHLMEHAPHTPDFFDLFKNSLTIAQKSLAHTPQQLKILREAKVVDAGAQGFVNILEGIVDFIEYGKIKSYRIANSARDTIRQLANKAVNSEINFRFCVECLLEKITENKELIRNKISNFGNSLVVAGSESKAHVHIHTNEPEKVLSFLSQVGNLLNTKVDDMLQQHTSIKEVAEVGDIGLVADSTCDLPPEIIEKHHIYLVPIVIHIGKDTYLDKVNMMPSDFLNILTTTSEKLLTSQPPPASFKEIYKQVISRYKNIISIHISEKLSGTIQGAYMGRKDLEGSDKIHIINSKNSTIALGLLIKETAQWIKEGLDLEEILKRLESAIKSSRIFIAVPTLKYIMRSGRLNRTKGLLGTMLNLKPILTLDSEGRIVEAAKVIGRQRVIKKTLDLALSYAKSVKNPRFGIAHVGAPDLANWYSKQISLSFEKAPHPLIVEASPALSLHIGVGGAAIAVLGDI